MRDTITADKRSRKIWLDKNDSPEAGNKINEKKVNQKNLKVLEFQTNLEDWKNIKIRVIIGRAKPKISIRR